MVENKDCYSNVHLGTDNCKSPRNMGKLMRVVIRIKEKKDILREKGGKMVWKSNNPKTFDE